MVSAHSQQPARPLDELLRHPGIWRARAADARPGLATGHPALDACLPGGGWPPGPVTEILCDRHGIGELGLVLPALARLSREGSWIVWVDPPWIPYAPALAGRGVDPARMLVVHAGGGEGFWAAEQALRTGACGAVLLWPAAEGGGEGRRMRRLQLAAEEGGTCGFLFQGERAAAQASPAALRLRVRPHRGGLRVEVLKCRGRAPAPVIVGAAGEGAGQHPPLQESPRQASLPAGA